MKKKYIRPAICTILLENTSHLLAGSDKFGVNINAEPVDPEETW